jgi:hypothetical protein
MTASEAGVVGATRFQFKKGAFAGEVSKRLNLLIQHHDLFNSATPIDTLSSVIAAIVGGEVPELLKSKPVTNGILLKSLFICFRPLFVKQVQGSTLNHGEQIIITLTHRVAKELDGNISDSQAQADIELIKKLSAQLHEITMRALRQQRSMQ